MFNGVTNIPNMVAFNFLKPWSWTSNYGNQIQFNYQDMDVPPQIAYMAQNAMNPAFWANYNLMTSMQPILPFTLNDFTNQQAINNSYQQGYQLGERLKLQSTLQTVSGNLNSVKQSVNSLLQRENLPADKKRELEEINKKIEKLEEKLQKIASEAQVNDPTKTKEKQYLEKYWN